LDLAMDGRLEVAVDGGVEVVRRPSRDVRMLGIGVIAALTILLYSYILVDIFNDWWTIPNLSYGLLIPPLALYLFWLERPRIESVPAVPDNWGLLLIAGAMCLLCVGNVAAEFFLQRISFIVLLAGLLWTFWGLKRFKASAFPLLLLTTMVPLPKIVYERLSTPLQLFASESATRIVQAIGVSAYAEGNVIRLADITLGVEEACSGLNSLSATAVSALLLAFMICRRPASRFAVVALAIPFCIFVNVIRIAGTAVIADHDVRFAAGFYHLFSGWVVFVGGLVLLLGAAHVISWILDGPNGSVRG
jgi:exosortase